MPTLKDEEEIKRYHVKLYTSDFEFIKATWGENNVSKILRQIVRKNLNALREKGIQKAGKMEEVG